MLQLHADVIHARAVSLSNLRDDFKLNFLPACMVAMKAANQLRIQKIVAETDCIMIKETIDGDGTPDKFHDLVSSDIDVTLV